MPWSARRTQLLLATISVALSLALLALLVWLLADAPGIATAMGAVAALAAAVIPILIRFFPPSQQSTQPDIDRFLDLAADKAQELPLDIIFGKLSEDLQQVKLPQVYTPLDLEPCTTQDLEDHRNRGLTAERARGQTILSAIDEGITKGADTDTGLRAVLLGDAGSGKSSLSAFLVWASRRLADTRTDLDWPYSLRERTVLRLNLRRMRQLIEPLKTARHGDSVDPLRLLHASIEDAIASVPGGWNEEDLCAARQSLMSLLEGRGLLIFDGLDEVLDIKERSSIEASILQAGARLGSKCALLVTSRPYARPKRLTEFVTWCMLPLSFPADDTAPSQVGALVERWHNVLHPQNAAAQSEALISALKSDKDRRDLAIRPLLLTLLIGIHNVRVKNRPNNEPTALPRIRVDLLNEATELLMDRWFRRIKDQIPEPVFLLLKRSDERDNTGLRRLAEEISFRVQLNRKCQVEDVTVDFKDLKLLVMEYLQHESGQITLDDAVRSAEVIVTRTALWLPSGDSTDKGGPSYAYIHRQFQEFLAACHMVAERSLRDTLPHRLHGNPEAWGEVARLAVTWTYRQNRDLTALEYAKALLEPYDIDANGISLPPQDKRERECQALLASARALLDLNTALDMDTLLDPKNGNPNSKARSLREALAIFRDAYLRVCADPGLRPTTRADAGLIAGKLAAEVGATLTELCDRLGTEGPCHGLSVAAALEARSGILPRRWIPDAGAAFGIEIEDFDWIYLDRSGTGVHTYVSRYPVTWGQFHAFLRSEAFVHNSGNEPTTPPIYWCFSKPAESWWWNNHAPARGGLARSAFSDPAFDQLPNFPVTGVSWFDAVAFCLWLEKQLEPNDFDRIRLPTWSEWNAAYSQWGTQSGKETPAVGRLNAASISAVGLWEPDVVNISKAGNGYPTHPKRSPVDLTGNGYEWILTAQVPGSPGPTHGGYVLDGPRDDIGDGSFEHRLVLGGIDRADSPPSVPFRWLSQLPGATEPDVGFRLCLRCDRQLFST